MSKVLSYDAAAHRALQRGFDTVADLVKVTHGPAGRSVVFGRRGGPPVVSDDAGEIVREVQLADPLTNVGASLAREVILKTDERAGLGGTTAVILAQAIIATGLRSVAAGANPVGIRRGVERAGKAVSAELRAHSRGLDTAEAVAGLAAGLAHSAEIGKLIAGAFDSIGPRGTVTVEAATEVGITMDLDRGVALDRGYLSVEMITDVDRSETVLDRPYVLAFDGVISANSDFIPLLEQVVAANAPLFIAAINVDGEALATITMNMRQKLFTVAAIKASWLAERRKAILQDIAVFTGGTVIGGEAGTSLATATLADLGRARRITVGRNHSLIVDGDGSAEAIAQRVRQLELELPTLGSPLERRRVEDRIAKLSGGVGVLRVGAANEVAQRQTIRRLERTVVAVRAAISDGVVPGGGAALVQVAPVLDELTDEPDAMAGIRAVRRALLAPLESLADNAGIRGAKVVADVAAARFGHGFDLDSGQITDLAAAGVSYPTEVLCSAVEAAASIAALVLTTDAIVAERPDRSAVQNDLGWHGRDVIADGQPATPTQRPPAHWRRGGPSRANTVPAPTGKP